MYSACHAGRKNDESLPVGNDSGQTLYAKSTDTRWNQDGAQDLAAIKNCISNQIAQASMDHLEDMDYIAYLEELAKDMPNSNEKLLPNNSKVKSSQAHKREIKLARKKEQRAKQLALRNLNQGN